MKIITFLLIITCFFTANGFTQVNFGPPQIISDTAYGASGIASADIDEDGDMDLVVAQDNKVVWYENTDGQGTYVEHIISTAVSGASSVSVTNNTPNSYYDVFSASGGDNKVAWYENINGTGTFGPQQIISSNATNVKSVVAKDISGDYIADVVFANFDNDQIVWNYNDLLYGGFGMDSVITDSVDGARAVFVCDMNNDWKNDVISGSYNDGKLAWYDNLNGYGGFSQQHIITDTLASIVNVYACDIDGDGDMDIFPSYYNDYNICWYRNDGSNIFSSHILDYSQNSIKSLVAADIDNDGDKDIIAASDMNTNIIWYENTNGQGFFSNFHTVTSSIVDPQSVIACDVDGDGDMDIVSTSAGDGVVAWYENHTVPNIISQPTNREVCAYQNTNFNVNATYTSNYQWQVDIGSGFSNIVNSSIYSGVNSNLLNISNIPDSMNGYMYRCILKSGNDSIFTNSVSLTVDSLPVISLPVTYLQCDNDSTIISAVVSSGNPGYSYNWSQGDTTSQIIVSPSDTSGYQLIVTDSKGCIDSVTTSVDVIFPDTTNICIVTVDTSVNKSFVVWERPNSQKTVMFNVYRETGTNVWTMVGSVPWDSMTVFLDTGSNPGAYAQSYKITTVDTCGNESPMSPFHKTMYLGVSLGSPGVVLDWTHYEDESGNFSPIRYYIYRRNLTLGGPFTLIDSIPANLNNYNDITAQPGINKYLVLTHHDNCIPSDNSKANGGPFAQSISNLDDYSVNTFIELGF